ncbi:ACT domain-containing protein [Allostreptomyces psammosilenae]|uniref:Aspartate kinase n=1 Tax=Allostreptomyces psammosilenae TaxID=1892865 RepID=A0A853ACY7_9ACTN|nr:ACT domain-containing protein [Allostreptomyces psammosilenae]NYI08202.1 hypothetical protein [Allostreptomyces psammosilenae]
MGAERDLGRLLRGMDPRLRAGRYVFCAVAGPEAVPAGVRPEATVVEDEGLTLVVPREQADAAGLAYDYVAAWITLRVHSALDAVGLTAAVAGRLAAEGISCNVLAGFHHDHLLVAADDAERAVLALRALAEVAAGDAAAEDGAAEG